MSRVKQMIQDRELFAVEETLAVRDLMNHELASMDEVLHQMRAYIHGTA